jgi:hypothetical protein
MPTVISRDELARRLREAFKNEICHADSWTRLADRVIDLMELAQRGEVKVKWDPDANAGVIEE